MAVRASSPVRGHAAQPHLPSSAARSDGGAIPQSSRAGFPRCLRFLGCQSSWMGTEPRLLLPESIPGGRMLVVLVPHPMAVMGRGSPSPISVCEEHPWHLLSCCLRPYWVLKGMIAAPIPYLWGRLTPKMSGATPEQPKSHGGGPGPSVQHRCHLSQAITWRSHRLSPLTAEAATHWVFFLPCY